MEHDRGNNGASLDLETESRNAADGNADESTDENTDENFDDQSFRLGSLITSYAQKPRYVSTKAFNPFENTNVSTAKSLIPTAPVILCCTAEHYESPAVYCKHTGLSTAISAALESLCRNTGPEKGFVIWQLHI